MISKKVLSTVIVFISLCNFGSAIKCYECQSDIDVNCGEPFNSRGIKEIDCTTKHPPDYLVGANPVTQCSKRIRQAGSNTVTNRGCFFNHPAKFVEKCMKSPDDGNIQFQFCDTCDGHLCNSAIRSYATTVIGVLILCLSVMMLI